MSEGKMSAEVLEQTLAWLDDSARYHGGHQYMTELRAHISTLQREADGMREALEPFARVAEFDTARNEADHDVFSPLTNNTVPHITIGDLRRALAALSPPAEADKGSGEANGSPQDTALKGTS